MKRNGAGLASICILSTMVLVMMLGAGSLYFGAEESDLRRRGAESLSSRAEQRIYIPILKKPPRRSWPGAELSMTS